MRVVYGSAFDAGVWPGPLGGPLGGPQGGQPGRDAAFDEAWVGPLGLLKVMETALGLGGLHTELGRGERAALLLPTLRATDGPWSRSLDADPLAVARAVLKTRDALVDAGLRPDVTDPAWMPARLRSIVRVCAGAVPGVADRFAAVAAALEHGSVDIERIDHAEPLASLGPHLRRVLAALAARGVDVRERAVASAAGADDAQDLAGARAGSFSPRGDGSLVLLRADCPEEAAAEVAAWIAALPASTTPVLIRPDAVLDAGLARLGLPTLGARGDAGDDALLQVAPLLLALAWPERDPERAFELLELPTSPVRRSVARPLARALVDAPAVDSDRWRERLDEAIAKLAATSPADAEKARERVSRIFGPDPHGVDASAAEMPLEVVERRLAFLRAWLHGRANNSADPAPLIGAISQVAALGRIARAFGKPALSRTELMRVIEQASAAARPFRARVSQVGFVQVGDPGAVVAPAAHVVWWGFHTTAEHLPWSPAVSRDERAILEDNGVVLRDPGSAAEERARVFSRPLACAERSLILCCPRRDRSGGLAHPHPLWDEIVARAGESAARALERTSLPEPLGGEPLARRIFRTREIAKPASTMTFPAGKVGRPDAESPSSREVLLGCTFRAVLQRSGVRAVERSLKEGPQLFGELAHDILAEVLRAPPSTGVAAAVRARELFDERTPRRAAALLRPIEATHRGRARETIARAAERFVDLLHERGLGVRAVEVEIERGAEGRIMKGRPDVVVGPPDVVVDFKTGNDRERRTALERGTALQLASYAALVKEPDGPWPGVGYFQIRSRRLLTTDAALGGDQTIEPVLDAEGTALRMKRLAQQAEALIAAGTVHAPGVGQRIDDLESRVVDGELQVAPPCRYCAFDLLCGRALPGGSGSGPRNRGGRR